MENNVLVIFYSVILICSAVFGEITGWLTILDQQRKSEIFILDLSKF